MLSHGDRRKMVSPIHSDYSSLKSVTAVGAIRK